MTQYVAPFIPDDSDTARHLDHITVQVGKDRARYAFEASQDSLLDHRTLGLTRVPMLCQQAAMSLVGTLVHHRSATVPAEVTRMFWEIASAHGISLEVHYPVPEFVTLAGGDWVLRVPRALAAVGMGLYNPIACPRAAHVQLQSRPGQRRHAAHHQAAAPRHVPPDGATHDAVARTPRAAPPLPRQRRPVASSGAGVPQPVRR